MAATKIGVLLCNLGTPDSTSTKDVRRYLREFLSDRRVVQIPKLLWWPLLNGLILPFRAAKSAALYESIWLPEGSPLLVYSQRLGHAIALSLNAEARSESYDVCLAMRYGQPSVEDGLRTLIEKDCEQLIILPLYPQYAASTVASIFDAVGSALRQHRSMPHLHFIAHYEDDSSYIQALSSKLQRYWQQHGRPQRLLLSYHGLPQRVIDAGDPYLQHCQKTSKALIAALGLADDAWGMSFQSRFGKEQWLEPATDHTLKQWATQGVDSVDVFCPGFAVDCLETLEEIAEENKAYFLAAGGQQYRYIPALNDDQEHASLLASLIKRSMAKTEEFVDANK